ncbi:MAG TPA: CGNR zinc finger domain-containing protein [Kutzneria sp.]
MVDHIPPSAVAIVDLLNSRPHATPMLPDTLASLESARPVIEPFRGVHYEAVSSRTLARIRELRADLLDTVTADDPAPSWARFTDRVSSVRFRPVFAGPDAVTLSQESGSPLIGGIVLAVRDLVVTNTWGRIRVCANEECSHAFYDTTRSRTQRWHSYEVCGNRSNVAAYRARKGATKP